MHAPTTTVRLLYVTDGTAQSEHVADGLSVENADVTVSTAAAVDDIGEQIGVTDVDCLLLGAGVDDQRCLDIVSSVHERAPSVPILVFAGDRGADFIADVLQTGATDVVRSTAADAPPALIRARVAGVLDDDDARIVRATGHKRQRELREHERLLEDISETVGDVIWVTTPDKDEMEFVSAAYEEVWGRPRERLSEEPMAFVDAVHPDDRERVRAALADQTDDPGSYEETYRVVQPDGEVRWVHDQSFGVYEDGTLKRIVGIARDVTEHRERELSLAAERDLVERILDTSPVGICVVDRDGDIVRVNDRAADIFGLSREEFTDRTYDDECWTVYDESGVPLDLSSFPAVRVFETGDPVEGWEALVERPDGEQARISVDCAPIREDIEVTRVVLAIEDVTERRRREEKIESQRDELARLDRLNAVIRDVDQALVGASTREEIEQTVCERLTASGEYEFALTLRPRGDDALEASGWVDAAAEFVDDVFPVEDLSPETSPALRALETGEVQVDQAVGEGGEADWHEPILDAGIRSLATVPVVYEGRDYGVVGVYSDERESFTERELEVLGELGETIGHAIAAAQSREREETLTALYEATRALLGARTREDVCEVVVDVATDVLDLPGVGVFLFDEEENTLQPAVVTDTLRSFYGGTVEFGPGQESSETWETYVTGERRAYDDVREAEHVIDSETDARSTLFVPLGDHGVFVASSAEVGTFDDQREDLVGLLATTTEVALDRVEDRADIRERDQELAERTRKLERVNRVNELIREIDQRLVHASTREEIEREVCERLVDEDAFAFAWVGTAPPDGDEVDPRTWAGGSGAYLDEVDLSAGTDRGVAQEPGARTAATGETTAVANVTDHLRDGSWARAAADRGYQSAVAVPLVYGETTYGVLAVYADEPRTFDEMVTSVLTELGESVAYSINVAETKRGILAERVTELELRIEDSGTFLNAVADLAGEPVEYLEISPRPERGATVLFALADPPVEEVLALESEFVAAESLSHVESGERALFRATVTGRTIPGTLLECGGVPDRIVADQQGTDVTVRVPQELDVRVFLDRLRETYPGTELVARRDREQSGAVETGVRSGFEDDLTDRQREVLQTAYESGYFESPRETTGRELADLLGVSQPTVTHHLREAQRRLFATLFDDSR